MFITLEGPEGSGKTTQAQRLYRFLCDSGRQAILMREPGGTALGDKLREIVMFSGDVPISSRAEVLLFAAARAQLVEEVLLPRIREGFIVVCDRYADSTLAYQGYGRGIDRSRLRSVIDFATGGLTPDLTFLFDVPVEIGLSRNRSGQLSADRFEQEDLDFHSRVRQGYLDMARAEAQRWVVINATLPVDAVWERVREETLDRLGTP
ncbi:MAG: dTMP kinase [Chloroflexi bacterium]|nr:dTMP kinase [Chloroflexota bacterium]